MAVPTESQLNNATLIPARHPLDPLNAYGTFFTRPPVRA